jgi:Mg/Co/Ni transporter MgtE
MLEKCNNDQRTAIIKVVAPELTHIALNMHGTRAVQRLIEYLSTPEQIKIVTNSLNPNVVTLIKDLNGNHVIQKCLHRLSPENNQFIYDAVCQNCIEVASHKHGCCVLQRCFDHATIAQKV